jgi:murein DD-endopeptidase MepM/ murein hydrolase activator NlpD
MNGAREPDHEPDATPPPDDAATPPDGAAALLAPGLADLFVSPPARPPSARAEPSRETASTDPQRGPSPGDTSPKQPPERPPPPAASRPEAEPSRPSTPPGGNPPPQDALAALLAVAQPTPSTPARQPQREEREDPPRQPDQQAQRDQVVWPEPPSPPDPAGHAGVPAQAGVAAQSHQPDPRVEPDLTAQPDLAARTEQVRQRHPATSFRPLPEPELARRPDPAPPSRPPPPPEPVAQPLVVAPVPEGDAVAVAAALPAGERFQPVPEALLVDAWYGRGGVAVPGEGLAIVAPESTPVHAVAAGTVGGQPGEDAVELRGDGGRRYRYGHLRPGSITVRAGQRIDAGSIVGAVGGGHDDPACLHLAVIDPDGRPVNPYQLLLGLADPNELGYRPGGLGIGIDPDPVDLGLGGTVQGSTFATAADAGLSPQATASTTAPPEPRAGATARPAGAPDEAAAGRGASSSAEHSAGHLLAGAGPGPRGTGGAPSAAAEDRGAGDPAPEPGERRPADTLASGPAAGHTQPTPWQADQAVDQVATGDEEPAAAPEQEPPVDQSLLASLLAPGAPTDSGGAQPTRHPGQGRGRQ